MEIYKPMFIGSEMRVTAITKDILYFSYSRNSIRARDTLIYKINGQIVDRNKHTSGFYFLKSDTLTVIDPEHIVYDKIEYKNIEYNIKDIQSEYDELLAVRNKKTLVWDDLEQRKRANLLKTILKEGSEKATITPTEFIIKYEISWISLLQDIGYNKSSTNLSDFIDDLSNFIKHLEEKYDSGTKNIHRCTI